MAIVEELAYTTKEFINKTILPVTANADCSFVGISTPSDEYNHFSEYLEKTDPKTGKPVWNVINAGQACQKCRDAGKAPECKHVQGIPPWKDQSKMEDLKLFLSKEDYDREMRGIVTSERHFLYKRPWIVALKQRQPYVFQRQLHVIYVGIDPGYSGALSDCVIGSYAIQNAHHTVLGLDATNSSDNLVQERMYKKHWRALRADKRYATAYIVLSMETNTDFPGTLRITRMLQKLDRKLTGRSDLVEVDSTDNKGRPGVRTGHEEKRVGADMMQVTLMNNALVYAHNFICAAATDSNDPVEMAAAGALIKHKFETQIQNYHKDVKTDKDGGKWGAIKEAFGGKGGGRRDDLCWVVQMLLFHSARLRNNDRFIEQAHVKGWLLC